MPRVVALVIAFCLCPTSLAGRAAAPSEITVGYYLQWPTPSQFAQVKQTYDSLLGIKVNWRAFDNGQAMNAALAAGQVQIAYAHGLVPFIIGVSGGLDVTMVGIALDYAENDLCIIANGSGIKRDKPGELEGRKVATVLGSVSHYKLLKMLEHLEVDPARVEILSVGDGSEAAAALRRGEVAMACAYGNALRAMIDLGQPLMTGAEQAAIGLKLFDGISVSTAFLQQYPQIVQGFMDVTEATNFQWRQNPEPMRAAIARAAEMDQASASAALAQFQFPSAAEQKSTAWLGAMVPAYTKSMADFFVAQGRLQSALESYDRFVSTRFLR